MTIISRDTVAKNLTISLLAIASFLITTPAESQFQQSGVTLCGDWNGYLGGMLNVAEHLNHTADSQTFVNTLYDQSGSAQGAIAQTIAANSQSDVVLNGLAGFTQNSLGLGCSNFPDSSNGDVSGRIVQYRFGSSGAIEFALTSKMNMGIAGNQFVPFNTFQPGLNPQGANDFLANWVSLRNMESTTESGDLIIYDRDGTELLSYEDLNLAAGQLFNIGVHELGLNKVGYAAWIPQRTGAKFRLESSRYFYDQPQPIEKFETATRLVGQKAISEAVAVPLDTTNGSAIVELSNTAESVVLATVTVYNSAGTTMATVPVYLAPHTTFHLLGEVYLPNAVGSAVVSADTANAILVSGLNYLRNDDLSLENAYSFEAAAANSATISSGYNTFLNQSCRLYLSNLSDTAENVTLTMISYTGEAMFSTSLAVPAKGTLNYSLCSNVDANQYGRVVLEATTEDSIVASVLRVGNRQTYYFSTLLEDPTAGEGEVENLRQLPSFSSMVRENESTSQAGISATSGTPPTLGEIVDGDIDTLFWRAGVIDGISSQNPSEQQCSEFNQGNEDGESGGMASCYLAQDVASSLDPIIQSGVSLCYMQNGPVQENLDGGAVAVISGELPNGDINQIFNPPVGSESRIVKLQLLEDGELIEDSLFARIYSTQENEQSQHRYRAQLWFCFANSGPAYEAQSYEIGTDGSYIVESLQDDEENRTDFSLTAALVSSDQGVVFDTASNRTVDIQSERGTSQRFRTNIVINGDNLISLKMRDSFDETEDMQAGERSKYSVARFAGTGVRGATFLEGAFKSNETFGDHDFTTNAAVEFRDTTYLTATSSTLLDLLDEVSLNSSFYQDPIEVEIDLNSYDCGTTPDIVIGMDLVHPLFQAVAQDCEGDRLTEIGFCNSGDIGAAQNEWFQSCVLD